MSTNDSPINLIQQAIRDAQTDITLEISYATTRRLLFEGAIIAAREANESIPDTLEPAFDEMIDNLIGTFYSNIDTIIDNITDTLIGIGSGIPLEYLGESRFLENFITHIGRDVFSLSLREFFEEHEISELRLAAFKDQETGIGSDAGIAELTMAQIDDLIHLISSRFDSVDARLLATEETNRRLANLASRSDATLAQLATVTERLEQRLGSADTTLASMTLSLTQQHDTDAQLARSLESLRDNARRDQEIVAAIGKDTMRITEAVDQITQRLQGIESTNSQLNQSIGRLDEALRNLPTVIDHGVERGVWKFVGAAGVLIGLVIAIVELLR